MRISIAIKVFATLLATTTVVVGGMYLFVQWSFEQGFIRFVEARRQERIEFLSQRLAQEYQSGKGWNRLRDNRQGWRHLLKEKPFGPPFPQGPGFRGRESRHRFERGPPNADIGRRPPPRPGPPRIALLDIDRSLIVGRVRDTNELELHPITVGNDTVGYLGLRPGPPAKEFAEIRFEERHTQSLAFIAVVMLLVSAALGFPLAYTLVRPLRRIAEASKQLARGRYETRLPITSRDEIGRLAQDMNDLAQALERTEQSRRRWVADISHELRTPLSVLRGEVEALQDGLRPYSAEALGSLHGEIMRLGRLVDELYQLSLSDVGALTYHKSRIDPLVLIEETIAALEKGFREKGITVTLNARPSGTVYVHADGDRLSQLFRNLLANSLKYSEPGGRVEVAVDIENKSLVFDFQDTDPPVPDEALAQLFDRFYRVDQSRNRTTGGAGLGLAICRNIVEAHEGAISARRSPLGGLWIRVELPVAP